MSLSEMELYEKGLLLQNEITEEAEHIDEAFNRLRKRLEEIKREYTESGDAETNSNEKEQLGDWETEINAKIELLNANHCTVMTVMESRIEGEDVFMGNIL